jgi:hypothetical protein
LVRCPYCGCNGGLKLLKSWRFRFYGVKRLEYLGCHGVFNHYKGVSPRGKKSEFVIRIKHRGVSE